MDAIVVVEKTLNDPFAGTDLKAVLEAIAPDRVLIAGWATDFCVDATVRSSVSHDHHVVVVADAHTLSDRPHLDAPGDSSPQLGLEPPDLEPLHTSDTRRRAPRRAGHGSLTVAVSFPSRWRRRSSEPDPGSLRPPR